MATIRHEPPLPRPEGGAPEIGAPDGAEPLRVRLGGRLPRVLLWLVVVGALGWCVDIVAGLHLLPPLRSLVPWGGGPDLPSAVSAAKVEAATERLDEAVAARLRGEGKGTAVMAGGASASASASTITTTTAGGGEWIRRIENPCVEGEGGGCRARAMDRFYAALRRTAMGEPGAVTRISHFGDSVIVEDLWTATVRRRLQERFGDGGPGFLFVAQPWEWYGHEGVALKGTEAWHIRRVTTSHAHDGRYGYGGVSFVAGGPGAKVTYVTEGKGGVGGAVSRADVYYLAQPDGGSVEVRVDDAVVDIFSTAAPEVGSGFRRVEMADGPHAVAVRSLGGGGVRLFGVTLERAGPGVVYDGIGLLGASARALLVPDAAHWAEQFAHRRPDLVVLTFGTNESDYVVGRMDTYRGQIERVVARIREVAPGASCLVVAPPDRGDPITRETRPVIPRIIEVQRAAALAGGCAFWDTYEAMGGKNTTLAWYRANPRRVFADLTHLSPAGGEILGGLLYNALLDGFVEYLER